MGMRGRAYPAIFFWAAGTVLGGAREDSAAAWIRRAVENQYRGPYSAEIAFVRESYLRGTDSLRGRLTFNDQAGERQFRVQGRDEAFLWWSRNFGQEQWWRDEKTRRAHRIPFRSLRKPAFGSLLTYEDLTKLPADYLLDFLSCKKLAETDSICELTLLLKPTAQSRYASLEVTLSRNPLLLRRVVFFGYDGRKLKSLEVRDYFPAPGGKFMPGDLRVFDSDSLSAVRLSLTRPQIAPQAAGRDHTSASQTDALSRIMRRFLRETRLEAAAAGEEPGGDAPQITAP
jgi:hypothetical protein